ncbi:MAG: selenobiotic family radical SAM modification target peptide [Geobacter sp.]|nr:selenobiotic family radical SAM modification target peptide [Geobacter sp.]
MAHLVVTPVREGGDNMEKDMIKSLVAGMGIAGLVAGTSLSAPALAAQSG